MKQEHNKINRRRNNWIILTIYSFLFTIYLFTSCSNPSENEDLITISGTVTLEGETDHSGVTVSLYEPVELDTTLVRINEEYPNIGIQITKEMEFFREKKQPTNTIYTANNGMWKFESIESKNYVINFKKSGFGKIVEFDISDIRNKTLIMKKEIDLYELLKNETNREIIFKNDYITINKSFEIGEERKLIFSEKNYLNFIGEFDINFNCNLSIKDDGKLFINSENEVKKARLNFQNNDNLILNNLLVFGNAQLNVTNSSLEISNCVFCENNNVIFNLKNVDGIITNCNFLGNNDLVISYAQSSKVKIINNIFLNNYEDIQANDVDDISIKSNFFSETQNNIKIINSKSMINNNRFEGAEYNIRIEEAAESIISRNYFNFNLNNIKTRTTIASKEIFLRINENNFINTDKFVVYLGYNSINDTVYAELNYWDTISENTINDKVFDKTDVEIINPDAMDNMGIVVYVPYFSTECDSAGL